MMPLTVSENQIGQLWSFAEVSRLNTGGGEGVEIVENSIFDVPLNSDSSKILIHDLPDYEDYESQKNNNNNNNKQRMVKKSLSKENFSSVSPRHRESLSLNPERSRSLDHTPASHTNEELNKRFLEHPVQGQYTHKIYMIASKIPWFVRKLIPKDSTLLHERSWNMYPTVKTVITNEYFRTNFRIELDTITKECENGEPEYNVHGLSAGQLEKREIVNIDISDPIGESDYKPDEDPTLVKSVKTNRGPLLRNPHWTKSNPQQPLICCYKLIFMEFKVFGLQTKSESYLKNMYNKLFAIFHRQVFCWLDKWHGLTMEDIRKLEHELAKLLVKKIDQGEISKNQLVNGEQQQ